MPLLPSWRRSSRLERSLELIRSSSRGHIQGLVGVVWFFRVHGMSLRASLQSRVVNERLGPKTPGTENMDGRGKGVGAI